MTKGGRDRRFIALVVVGDRKGRVGIGQGKAREVSEAIRKGTQTAQRNMERMPSSTLIPHKIIGRFGAAQVLLRPASPGTGVIAGSAVRAVLEAVGVQNVLSKSLGSDNVHNIAMATLDALTRLRSYRGVHAMRGIEAPMPRKAGSDLVAAEEAPVVKAEAPVVEPEVETPVVEAAVEAPVIEAVAQPEAPVVEEQATETAAPETEGTEEKPEGAEG